MAKMSMRVILKSGAEFTVKCDKFTLERNGLEQVTGYNIGGITENKPVYLDFGEVAAIVRVLSDEADAPPKMATTKSKRKARVQTWARKKRALITDEVRELINEGCAGQPLLWPILTAWRRSKLFPRNGKFAF